jgi:hypothetical protein
MTHCSQGPNYSGDKYIPIHFYPPIMAKVSPEKKCS